MATLFLWLIRIVSGLVGLVIVLLVVGFVYQRVATWHDRHAYPPPGQLVDVGGYKMHLSCLGEGTPTVILDAGQPMGTPSWAWIQPEIAKNTRVCAYDRAGFGWSEAGPEPRDGKQMAHELHTLLRNAGVSGPYVLVAHSWGGLVSHILAAETIDEVAGIVWIEALHPDNFPRKGLRESTMSFVAPEQIAFLPWLARIGVLRLLQVLPVDPDLPSQQQAEYRAFFASTQTWEYIVAVETSFTTTNDQAWQAGSVGSLPLTVIIGGESEASGMGLAMQQELQTLSSRSTQQVISGATHNSLLHKQEHAAQTSRAILEMVKVAGTVVVP